MTSIQRSPRRTRAAVATVATAAVLALPVVAAVPAAADDGPNGEVTGYTWDEPGVNLWEGTYRMFDGTEAWCATVGAWEPGDNEYGDPQPLDLGNAQKNSELAYIVSEASGKVLGKTGEEARDYAAAASIIIHDWTNSHGWKVNIPAPGPGLVTYNPTYPLAWFDKTGREGVQEAYDALLADAALYAGAWELELAVDIDGEPAIGDEFEIEGVLSVGLLGIAAHDVELTVAGATIPAGTIVTGADGSFSTVATITGTEVEVEASAVAPASQVYYRAPLDGWNTPDRPQDMITVAPTYLTEKLDFTVAGIGTTATNSLPFDGGIVVDTVAYENLIPGATYTIEGELYDKADGTGTGITAEKEFQASTSGSGTVDIEFTVPHGHDGKTYVVFERVYNAAGKLVAAHEDIDDAAQTVVIDVAPDLQTYLYTVDGDSKELTWRGGTVRDVITYTNLPAGDYVVRGELFDRATNAGTGILGESDFTVLVDEPNGSVEVLFDIPEGHAGKTLVAFEWLYRAGQLDVPIAQHTDIDSDEQAVWIAPQPVIDTSATDQSDGDRLLPSGGGTIVDAVRYENLEPGVEYTLTGELIDKATGTGTGLTGQTVFTPDEPNGLIDVVFTVPSGYAGKTLVVFERLYDAQGLVATHEDIDAEAQTVSVEPPPSLATTGGQPNDGLMYGAFGLIAAGALAFLVARRQRA